MGELEVQLAARHAHTQLRIALLQQSAPIEPVAAPIRFRSEHIKVRVDRTHGVGKGSEAVQLRVMAIPSGAAPQNCLSEQTLPPRRYEADPVKQRGMQAPDSHPATVSRSRVAQSPDLRSSRGPPPALP